VNARRLIPLAIAGTGLALVAGTAPAYAGTTPSPTPSTSTGGGAAARTCSADRLAYVQARVDAAVKKRQVTIDRLTSALAARTHVTDAHRATLSGTYSADSSGLAAVDAKVQSDTTCGEAVADGRTVVTDYRVYLLLVPQTHLVAASDTGTYAAGQLAAVEPKAQAAIDALTDPQEKAAAQAKLDDLTAQVATATTALSGVADAMLALNPADIPAQLATIDGYRAKVASAHEDLRRAIADAKALKALLGHPAAGPAATPSSTSS
jgi:hypothetical protein